MELPEIKFTVNKHTYTLVPLKNKQYHILYGVEGGNYFKVCFNEYGEGFLASTFRYGVDETTMKVGARALEVLRKKLNIKEE